MADTGEADDKKKQTQEQRRDALAIMLSAGAAAFRTRIEAFIEGAKSAEVADLLKAALDAKADQAEALQAITDQLDVVSPSVSETFVQAGEGAIEEVGAESAFASKLLVRLGIVFDPNNARAAALVTVMTKEFLQDMEDAVVDAALDAMRHALEVGDGPLATARAIQDSIGLTAYQNGIVRNYADSLRSANASALDYQLRNQGRDATVQAAVDGRRVMSSGDTGRMIDQYRDNYVGFRSETIARTMSTRVTNAARQESYQQIADKMGSNYRMLRTWVATEDNRTRDWHASMDGQEVGLDEPFTDGLGNDLMYPGDPNAPAETVINCRCTMTMRFEQPS